MPQAWELSLFENVVLHRVRGESLTTFDLGHVFVHQTKANNSYDCGQGALFREIEYEQHVEEEETTCANSSFGR